MKTLTARVVLAILVLFVAGSSGYSDTTHNMPPAPAQPAPQSKAEKAGKPAHSCPKTQDLVEKAAAAHPEAAAVAIHAQPKGFDHSFRIASSKRDLIGEADEEDDLDAMRGNRTVVLAPGAAADDDKGKTGGKKETDDDEAAFWDVTLPLHTAGAAAPVGVLEVLLKADAAKTKAEAQAKAEAVRAEVEKGLAVTDQKWP
jgi:hypothetical protein